MNIFFILFMKKIDNLVKILFSYSNPSCLFDTFVHFAHAGETTAHKHPSASKNCLQTCLKFARFEACLWAVRLEEKSPKS